MKLIFKSVKVPSLEMKIKLEKFHSLRGELESEDVGSDGFRIKSNNSCGNIACGGRNGEGVDKRSTCYETRSDGADGGSGDAGGNGGGGGSGGCSGGAGCGCSGGGGGGSGGGGVVVVVMVGVAATAVVAGGDVSSLH